MRNGMTITIKKRSQSGWLLWLIIVLPFWFSTLNGLFGAPYSIRYILDLAWFALFMMMLTNRQRSTGRWLSGLHAWLLVFFVYTFLMYLVQFQNPLYYLWGVRNDFRFYVVFFAFVIFLKESDVEDYLKLFDAIFWINTVVSAIQFVVLGVNGDNLGGVFGTDAGGNGYTNIFFLIIAAKSVVLYLEKKERTVLCFCKCVVALVIAALAELKFFFVEFVIVLVLAVLFTNFTWRKFWLILGGAAAVIVGIILLSSLFPNAGWFSLEWFIKTATSEKGYTSSGDLNRLTAISSINELWLKNLPQRVFGLGLGNCDTSSFEFLNTPFYEVYGDMHYTWLSYAMMYLECGWIGLAFYFGFFILVFFAIRKIEKKAEGLVCAYCRFAKILAVMWAIVSIYNSSLRTEAGYMAYFALAIPFILSKARPTKSTI